MPLYVSSAISPCVGMAKGTRAFSGNALLTAGATSPWLPDVAAPAPTAP
jgi:hypothetical protein